MDTNYFENLNLRTIANTISTDSFPIEFPLHWHKYVEVVVLQDSAGSAQLPVLHIGRNDYTLEPGDLLFVWPGELHSISCNTAKGLSGVQFSLGLLYELSDMTFYINNFRNIHHISMKRQPELAQTLQMYIHQLFQIDSKEQSFPETEKALLLLEIFLSLGKTVESDLHRRLDSHPSLSNDTIQRIRETCNYISNNCDKELTLDNAAAFAGFSPSYFSKVFKQVTKYNFVEYLALQRVRLAQTLLSDVQLPITEVSSKSGFKSISTFNRVFRQYKNCSPSEYRKFMV